jgi:threonine synthase
MKLNKFPPDAPAGLMPQAKGEMYYQCLGCGAEYPTDALLYTCPKCGSVFMLYDRNDDWLHQIAGKTWRQLFDYRKMANVDALKGIFLFHELIASIIPPDKIIYLGEGHTPVIRANPTLRSAVGGDMYFKNDGQNPSASFKDRGMACALSYLNYLMDKQGLQEVLAICASTGDTSASAALYGAYLSGSLKSAVLLPRGKVTAQQLGQPLGSGAEVIELPGVFDDVMKIVERLAEHYHVALLNSKNAWRLRGQESYSYEISQWFDYDTSDMALFIPIGNAGNITAVMSGFIRLYDLNIIQTLPKIVGVQSHHADPVFRYYLESDPGKRRFVPVRVRPSVAQAAMIGNPVSMPRVIRIADEYETRAGKRRIFVIQVTEQSIMDNMLMANRQGHIVCTQGGESLAGFREALASGIVSSEEVCVLDSTAHTLKFASFQEMYFNDEFPAEYEVVSKPELKNKPRYVRPCNVKRFPGEGSPLSKEEYDAFVDASVKEIARILNLKKKGA